MLDDSQYRTLEGQSELQGKSVDALSILSRALPALAIGIIAGILDPLIWPYQRYVSDYADGPSISHPKLPQTVSMTMLYIYAWLLPAVIMAILSAWRRNWNLFHVGLVSLIEASAITAAVSVFAMKMAGSLRPNFYAQCQWNGTACKASDSTEIYARQSFPSYEAAIAAAGLTTLSLFIPYLAKVSLKRDSTFDNYLSLFRVLAILPILFAVWIAITRTTDYYNRFEDITAGLALGAGVACAVVMHHLNARDL